MPDHAQNPMHTNPHDVQGRQRNADGHDIVLQIGERNPADERRQGIGTASTHSKVPFPELCPLDEADHEANAETYEIRRNHHPGTGERVALAL